MRWSKLVSFMLVVQAACAPTPSQIPVIAAAVDLRQLAGHWEGEYSASASGRTGSIVFHLVVDDNTAVGDVLMVPQGHRQPIQPSRNPDVGGRLERGSPQPLTITFVQVQGRRVSGILDPYRDPDCGCILHTTFEGTLNGDVITGSFVSRGSSMHPHQSGSWEVRRKR
jgi:hypothetical protein